MRQQFGNPKVIGDDWRGLSPRDSGSGFHNSSKSFSLL